MKKKWKLLFGFSKLTIRTKPENKAVFLLSQVLIEMVKTGRFWSVTGSSDLNSHLVVWFWQLAIHVVGQHTS